MQLVITIGNFRDRRFRRKGPQKNLCQQLQSVKRQFLRRFWLAVIATMM